METVKRSINLKIDDDIFQEMKAYAAASGSSLTGMVRGMVMQSLFETLSSDQSEFKRLNHLISQADDLGMTNRDKADLELRISVLKAKNERFAEFFNDLAYELYGKKEDDDA